MARLILDTSVLIAAEREVLPPGLFSDEDDIAVAAISVAELMIGVELADDRRRAGREEFVTGVLDTMLVEDYDLRVAMAHAALMADNRLRGKRRGDHDLIVAATARARGREVLTLDRRGFEDLPRVKVHAPLA
jgi:tRNA(fMet)-specific endonuclease VapC